MISRSPEREGSLSELSNLPEFLETAFISAEPIQSCKTATHFICADFSEIISLVQE
jgi:hypothetical protein